MEVADSNECKICWNEYKMQLQEEWHQGRWLVNKHLKRDNYFLTVAQDLVRLVPPNQIFFSSNKMQQCRLRLAPHWSVNQWGVIWRITKFSYRMSQEIEMPPAWVLHVTFHLCTAFLLSCSINSSVELEVGDIQYNDIIASAVKMLSHHYMDSSF